MSLTGSLVERRLAGFSGMRFAGPLRKFAGDRQKTRESMAAVRITFTFDGVREFLEGNRVGFEWIDTFGALLGGSVSGTGVAGTPVLTAQLPRGITRDRLAELVYRGTNGILCIP